ncbi:uncharacterized protein TRUGW13939_11103 [Talaromyces rugulosus]|uniref:Uncharacterized protein n=1 Tax=Talaromyces rugulosus TaxID=121627 RepID=A0A7H8RDZ0_TALRU|nr:uncharacterized protein TRUGW13939_11103 [Talaromyces rugulosus]QKX63931.1 hypothetical protein TRUGW13939_11103 [Talaromyces rugulosus]
MKDPTSLFPTENSSGDAEKELLVKQRSVSSSEDGTTYDIATTTRSACIVAVSTGAILALLCFVTGIYIFATNGKTLVAPWSISSAGQEALVLAVNAVLTLCIDGMMLVHSVSLRWALYRDGRLEYNTNIRLFTSLKSSGPNKWYINALALFCLVLSYGSSSILLLDNQEIDTNVEWSEVVSGQTRLAVNATALVALALGLAGQAAIAVWCLTLSSSKLIVPTWSSNPLNTTLAAMQNAKLTHRPGRCMLSVHQRHEPSNQAVYPAAKQGNILQAQRGTVQYILTLLWTLAIFAIAWPIAVAAVSMRIGNASAYGQAATKEPSVSCWRFGFDWNEDSSACFRNYVTLSLSPSANTHNPNAGTFSYGAQAVLCLLLVCAIQAGQTIALHCAELLVNLSRDEATWRKAYSNNSETTKKRETAAAAAAPGGAQLRTNPFSANVSSWESIVLFIAKAVMHWIIGRSVLPSIGLEDNGESYYSPYQNGLQFDMVYSRLIIFAVLAILLAVFATYLALQKTRGCQPATFGHLQTLADLVDDWETDHNGRLWWGDKTLCGEADSDGQTRHAGTSCDRALLSPIYAGAAYSGMNT